MIAVAAPMPRPAPVMISTRVMTCKNTSRVCANVGSVGLERRYRFGVFFFDAESGELTRDGRPIRLQPQPGQVLATLLARAGEVVTREELRRAVWPGDTFVDFDRGLNFCIAQVRSALGDEAGAPRYIRTVPKKGYEFICPVEAASLAEPVARLAEPDGRLRGRRMWLALAIAAAAILAASAYFARQRGSGVPIVAVARFDNETGNPELSAFGDTLTDTVVEQLTGLSGGNFDVVGNAALLRRPRDQRDLAAIATSLHAEYIVLTQLQRDNEQLRVLSHLIHLPEQTHVTVSRTDGIANQSLPATDEIAARIARTFAPHVRDRDVRAASRRAPSP
jgi:DNA-binding winged helix-turn-helix (wHTH) protein/TolB-like protein